MSKIKEHIEKLNRSGRKALSIFLTAGFPKEENFLDLARYVLESGADMLEVGIPFSDSLADGPVVQQSYHTALQNGTTLEKTIKAAETLTKEFDKPIILMGSANPVVRFGKEYFVKAALEAKVSGVIIPDVPVEEYDGFFENKFNGLDTILLTTPTSSEKRIKTIDSKSGGFVYCVSVVGITGVRNEFKEDTIKNIERTYKTVSKNKMMIGFGISKPENVKTFSPFCDGVIVGSAVIKTVMNDNNKFEETRKLIKILSDACNQ